MLQSVKPFMSRHDIDSGARWGAALAGELAESNFGILCLTPAALKSEWLLFEAGALTKLEQGKACGLLYGIGLKDVSGPLSQFQHRNLEREDFGKLLQDLNKAMPSPLEVSAVSTILEMWWPRLAQLIAAIPAEQSSATVPQRSSVEVLEELVQRVRNVEHVVVARDALTRGLAADDDADLGGPARLKRLDRLLALPREDFALLRQLVATFEAGSSPDELMANNSEKVARLRELGMLKGSSKLPHPWVVLAFRDINR